MKTADRISIVEQNRQQRRLGVFLEEMTDRTTVAGVIGWTLVVVIAAVVFTAEAVYVERETIEQGLCEADRQL